MLNGKRRDCYILGFSFGLYTINRFLLKDAINIPVFSYFLRGHFNDLLAGVSFLAYTNMILANSRYSQYRIQRYNDAIWLMIACGITWEYLFVHFRSNSISDFKDIIAYVLGGCIYILLQRRTTT